MTMLSEPAGVVPAAQPSTPSGAEAPGAEPPVSETPADDASNGHHRHEPTSHEAPQALGISRRFTTAGVDPADGFDWERRDARLIDHRDGSVAFEQTGVEVTVGWSQNATNILAQKYFRGTLGTPQRERSLRQVVARIADTITAWGDRDGYFADRAERDAFNDELKYLLYAQRAAFNSPVWFNIGVEGVPQQASACFILSVDDTMESILDWYAQEGIIFKGGSGAGVNLSRLRAGCEPLRGGGTASGPVSFMRGADASAGTIKSGGKTRRAAKMVVLDADHPDVEEFIWCKAREERKSRALAAAGFDMGMNGRDATSIQYQNANNSVRVSDEFMQAALDGRDWELTARTDGSVVKRLPARKLLREMAEAAWECADPGVQFESTINRWHTAAATGPINASNPCSEYVHLDNSACNLASLNLLSFLEGDDTFDIDGFRHAVQVVLLAQEILVGNADYPTEAIAGTTRAFRQLGLGYANLGALLMALGMAYDSDAGRATAACITALMTGEAYSISARMAARMGPFAGYHLNREHMLGVLRMHRDALDNLERPPEDAGLFDAARLAWQTACDDAGRHGVRNSQATVLAPTGTIGLLMDCDTTGIEPDLALVKHKRLVGGGSMAIVNQTVARALRRLGYPQQVAEEVLDHIGAHGNVIDAPIRPEHRPVFACSLGEDAIHSSGHVKMMGAVQPFLSGAISKTVNMPEWATIDDVEDLFINSWRLGLKAVAIYRDNCKLDQPLSEKSAADTGADPEVAGAVVAGAVGGLGADVARGGPVRERLPRSRRSRTFEFRVADCKGFVTVGEYDDGRPGEIFVRVSKQGSTLAGIMDAFAISLSHGLQYGVPLSAFAEAFVGMRFEPAGMTDDPDIRIASSLMDYLFRRLAVMYMSPAERAAMGIFTTGERTQPTLPGVEEQATETVQGYELPPDPPSSVSASQSDAAVAPGTAEGALGGALSDGGAPFCMLCGVTMQRAGSCYVCADCGATSGCS